MILVLFMYVADVAAIQNTTIHSTYQRGKRLNQELPLDYYDGDLPPGDAVHANYGITDFWWDKGTTTWMPWWEKNNVTIPEPRSETEPDIETTIETSATSEGANDMTLISETTSENETAILNDTAISNTTELPLSSTTPADEDQRNTITSLHLPGLFDANLLAQLRVHQSLAAASSTQKLSQKPDYDYYGELHDEIPPNVRGPEYPGLSPDIPVILKNDNKTQEKKLPGIREWRLQYPEQSKKVQLSKGTKPAKTTFHVTNVDYNNFINDGIIIEPLPAVIQNGKSTAIVYNSLRSMDYPGDKEIPAISDSKEVPLGTYKSVPFKYDEIATEQSFMAQFSKAGPEGIIKIQPTLPPKAVKALSPIYTVPHSEEGSKPTITYKIEPTTTRFITQPTTKFMTQPTMTTAFTIVPTTNITQPSTLEPALPLTNYIQTYEVDWNIFSTPQLIDADSPSSTVLYPLVQKLKEEMAKKKVGYFSVCLKKFFGIFSSKDSKALTELLKGGSDALERMNEDKDLEGLGPPMWPGTELGFLQMRLAPIDKIKSRARIAYKFYASGLVFEIKSLHERIDNLYYQKDGEDMMQAIAEFDDYPGANGDMDPSQVMEHLFRALLRPYLRDKKSTRVMAVVAEINDKISKISKTFFGGSGRRNLYGESEFTSTSNHNFNNKLKTKDYNKTKTKDYKRTNEYEESDNMSSEIANDNNAVKHKVEIDEKNTIYDSYDDKSTEKLVSVAVIKDAIEDTSGRIGDHKATDMGFRVKDGVSKDTALYNYDKYSTKIPKKYPIAYKNAKKTFKSSKNDKRLLKYNKQKNIYKTNRARNGETNQKKWYIEIIKYNNLVPKRYDRTENKINHINSKDKINRKIKHVSSNQKFTCYDNNDGCDTNAVAKRVPRNNYDKNKEGYGNSYRKVRTFPDTKDRTQGQIGNNKEVEISYSGKQKVSTNFYHHVKYVKKQSIIFHHTYKKATRSSKKDRDNGVSKDIKVNTNYKYFAKNEEPSYTKRYLETSKYNQSDSEIKYGKDKKIGYINIKNKRNLKTKYVRSTYQEKSTLQTMKSKINTTSKISDLSYKGIKKIYDYETYEDETESSIWDNKENKKGNNGKSELSKNKGDDYNTFDDSVDSKEIKHSKNDTGHLIDELDIKHAEVSSIQNSVKAKDYIKELRIRRTTKEKEYFSDTKQYYATTISSHREKPTQTTTSTTNETENILEDWNALKKNKNKKFQDNANNTENKKIQHKETKLEQHDNLFNAKKSKTKVKYTTNLKDRSSKLRERVLQKGFTQTQNTEAKNNERLDNFLQNTKPLRAYSNVPDLQQNDHNLKNKKENISKDSENYTSNNETSEDEKSIKFWPSKSQYIVKDALYLKERFLDFNRENTKTNILRNLDKNKNILRIESSYSDEEEVLKSNLQDNLLHGGRNFADTLPKYNNSKGIRDISSYSDEEDTLKKNIYKLFT